MSANLLIPPDTINERLIAELHELDEGGPPVIFRELVELFNESTPQLLSQACKPLANPTQLAMIGHTLKGSCSNFGAHRMEAVCLQLEQLGRGGRSDGAREIIDSIEREFFNVRAALTDHCG